jgi:hypothetical protein
MCVCIFALVIRHATDMFHMSYYIIICLVWLYSIFPHYPINVNSLRKNVSAWNMCFDFLYSFSQKHFSYLEEFGELCPWTYRVINKSLCTWWLPYRNLKVMFKMSPASLQIFIGTRLTLTPSVILNSIYVIMVSDWNCLKRFLCVFYTEIIRCTETFKHPIQ